MKYTKQQLLGAIFQWEGRQYMVVDNGNDTQLKALFNTDKIYYPSYTVDFLNSCLEHLKKLQLYYEIY